MDSATTASRFRNTPDGGEEDSASKINREISNELKFSESETVCNVRCSGGMLVGRSTNIARKGAAISVAAISEGRTMAADCSKSTDKVLVGVLPHKIRKGRRTERSSDGRIR